jgi:hypothetical protein
MGQEAQRAGVAPLQVVDGQEEGAFNGELELIGSWEQRWRLAGRAGGVGLRRRKSNLCSARNPADQPSAGGLQVFCKTET